MLLPVSLLRLSPSVRQSHLDKIGLPPKNKIPSQRRFKRYNTVTRTETQRTKMDKSLLISQQVKGGVSSPPLPLSVLYSQHDRLSSSDFVIARSTHEPSSSPACKCQVHTMLFTYDNFPSARISFSYRSPWLIGMPSDSYRTDIPWGRWRPPTGRRIKLGQRLPRA